MSNNTIQEIANKGYDLIRINTLNVQAFPTVIQIPAEAGTNKILIQHIDNNVDQIQVYIGNAGVQPGITGYPLFNLIPVFNGVAIGTGYGSKEMEILTHTPENFYLTAFTLAPVTANVAVMYFKNNQN